jgi:DNA-binding MarR family transcriptional regulator
MVTLAMSAKRFDRRQAAATDVWRLMAGFSFAQFQHGPHQDVMREHGLTPGHLKALTWIDPERPLPMRAMADALDVDASMITWLVDRLEEKGLVERRPMPSDRRVKAVALTELGVSTRDRLTQAMLGPPQELLDLDLRSLEELRAQLRKLPSSSTPVWWDRAAPDGGTGDREPSTGDPEAQAASG